MDDFLLGAGELRARTGAKWRMHPADVLPAFVAEMDFKGAPAIQAAADASMVLICNPQNPTGRVFERPELETIAAIAAEHELTIVSDEIHSDLVYPGRRHIPMETVGDAAQRTVTLTSATKGFNIPGLR